MASDNIKEALRAAAVQIRDEKITGANTAFRVGSLLLAMINATSDVDMEHLSKFFLRKDRPDVASEVITFLKGIVSDIVQSSDFSAGELGSGFIIRNDADGSYMEIDRLLVRRIAYFVELVIKSLKHVGGSIVLTPASLRCSKVEEYDSYYRCYFDNERDGKTIKQEFVAGDQARSQTFNVLEGENHDVGSHFYWRLVVAVGDNFIDLSKVDCASGSLEPLAGDDIVQLGNRSDTSRQHAVILSAYGDDAPSFKQYTGICDYSLTGKEVTVISRVLNSFTGRFKSSVTGRDFDAILDEFNADLSKIKSQSDKEYTIWFFEYEPTLQNLPASDWDDDDKVDHEYDLFYYSEAGLAWRFVSGRWQPITDKQTLAALEKAKKAQDTADGKRRNFVSQPMPPYDEGDTWSNASYDTLYANDDLVCIKSKVEGEAFSIDDWQPASDMNSGTKKVFMSRFDQLEDSITLEVVAREALSNTVENLSVNLDGAKGEISALAALFDADGHLIEGSGWVTSTQYASLYSKVQGIDGALSAKAEVRTSVQYDPNTGVVTSAVKLTADHISLEGVTTINNSFSVDTDGTARIGGFVVSGNGLTNRNEDGTFTNDAYIVFRNDDYNCFAGIGGNILPSSSGLRAVARFENHDNSDWWGLGLNCAMLVSAQGSDENIAIRMDGGSVTCFALKTRIIGHESITASTKPLSASYSLDRHVGSLYVSTQFNWRSSYSGTYASNTRDMHVTLPVMQSYDDGHAIKVKRGPNDGNNVFLYPAASRYSTMGFSCTYEVGTVYHDISRYNLPSGVELPFSIDLNGAASCYVWLLNSSNEVLASAYRLNDGAFTLKAVLPSGATGSSVPAKLQIQTAGCTVTCYHSGMSNASVVEVWGQSAILYDSSSYATELKPLEIGNQGDSMELVYHRDLTVTIDSVIYHGLWVQFKHPRNW